MPQIKAYASFSPNDRIMHVFRSRQAAREHVMKEDHLKDVSSFGVPPDCRFTIREVIVSWPIDEGGEG